MTLKYSRSLGMDTLAILPIRLVIIGQLSRHSILNSPSFVFQVVAYLGHICRVRLKKYPILAIFPQQND